VGRPEDRTGSFSPKSRDWVRESADSVREAADSAAEWARLAAESRDFVPEKLGAVANKPERS
jgi:hypothetical protein